MICGLPCPSCGSHRSEVKDSRSYNDNSIYRRRKCKNCGERYTTLEYVAADLPDEMFPQKYKFVPRRGMVPL